MFPSQQTWSATRSNLLQRCPRAFVMRYGLGAISQHHPIGQDLLHAFEIQTPWILLHQTIRIVVLDYVEDYTNGTIWSIGLLRARFVNDFTQLLEKRNQIIERIQTKGRINISNVQTLRSENHLIEMGVKASTDLVQHPDFVSLLRDGSISRIEPTHSIKKGGMRIYNAPDFIHRNKNSETLVKLNPFGDFSAAQRQHQAALLRLHGGHGSTIVQFSLQQRRWDVRKTIPTEAEINDAITLVRLDIEHMEGLFSLVGRNNNLDNVPLSDTYRSCMNCQVRSMCPSKDGLERAKAEQFALMCV